MSGNNKDVVLIPAYGRPEFLQVCLELIERADYASSMFYIFALDHGFDPRNMDVIHDFHTRTGFDIITSEADPIFHKPSEKQSFNLLRGYKMAYDITDGFIFMIEDDVFISNDFFKWHYVVHEKEPNLFCSIGSENHNTKYRTSDDLESYYLSHGDYQSIGVAFRSGRVPLFLNRLKPSYFDNPIEFCENEFPNSGIPRVYAEQDGFIRRVHIDNPYSIAFPHVPRAYHAGFYGMHRGGYLDSKTPMGERVDFVKKVAFDSVEMRKRSGIYDDSNPISLVNGPWKRQMLSPPM